jgi:hypothetical protein
MCLFTAQMDCSLVLFDRCILSSAGNCTGLLRLLKDEDREIVVARSHQRREVCNPHSTSICRFHSDSILYHYSPTLCCAPACPVALPHIPSTLQKCPQRMLACFNAPPGSFVHLRPCKLQFDNNYSSHPLYSPPRNNSSNSSNDSNNNSSSKGLTREEEIQLHQLLHKQKESGILRIKGKRGRALHLLQLPHPELDCNESSSRTRRKRAKIVEDTRAFVSHTDSNSNKENEDSENRLLQLEMKREPDKHITASQAIGLTIQHKLTPHQTLHLKTLTGMSYSMLRTLRSFFLQYGISILASEVNIREDVHKLKHETEAGMITILNKQIVFVRVVDIANVLSEQLSHLTSQQQLHTHGCIKSGDIWINLI